MNITKTLPWSVTTCICKNKTVVWFYSDKIFCSCSGPVHTPSPLFNISKEVCQRYNSQQLHVSFVTGFSELQFRSEMSSFLKIPRVLLVHEKYRWYIQDLAVRSLALFDTRTKYINLYLGLISLRLSAAFIFFNIFAVSLKKKKK